MKYLLWDFDGTLAFRDGLWSGALADALQSQLPDSKISAAQFAPFLKSGFFWHDHATAHPHVVDADAWWSHLDPVLSAALQKGAGLDAEVAAALLPTVRSAYVAPATWHSFPDVLPCLDAVSAAGWSNAILSNHVPELPHIIESLGLTHRFDYVFNSATTGYEKPHRQAFNNVLQALRNATSVWMIGDNYEADIIGAETAGIPAILVRRFNTKAKRFHADLSSLSDFLMSV